MQKFDENTLRNMAKGVSCYYIKPDIDDFISDLQEMAYEVLMASKRNDISVEIKPFGAYNIYELSNQQEYINLGIVLSSDLLYKDTEKVGEMKLKTKRKKACFLEEFKYLLVILLEKYLAHKVSIKMNNNSLFVESLYLIGANFRLFVFTQSFSSDKLLAISSTNLLPYSFDINMYEKNFMAKNIRTHNNYGKICNVIKSLCIDQQISNDSIAIESILYNVDDRLFEGYINEQLFKIFNEVKFISNNSFVCMDAKIDKKLFANAWLFPGGAYRTKIKYNKLVDAFSA